jgi:hypothetical protein
MCGLQSLKFFPDAVLKSFSECARKNTSSAQKNEISVVSQKLKKARQETPRRLHLSTYEIPTTLP